LAKDGTPEWVKDREALWNKAEAAEKRSDARTAREYRLALPAELTREQNVNLVREWVQENITKHGVVADVSIHRADKYGDQRNVHAHILVTTRTVDGESLSRKKAEIEGYKRGLDSKPFLKDLRRTWEETANKHLEMANVNDRISSKTLKEQGIDREPEKHRGNDKFWRLDEARQQWVSDREELKRVDGQIQRYEKVLKMEKTMDDREKGEELKSRVEGVLSKSYGTTYENLRAEAKEVLNEFGKAVDSIVKGEPTSYLGKNSADQTIDALASNLGKTMDTVFDKIEQKIQESFKEKEGNGNQPGRGTENSRTPISDQGNEHHARGVEQKGDGASIGAGQSQERDERGGGNNSGPRTFTTDGERRLAEIADRAGRPAEPVSGRDEKDVERNKGQRGDREQSADHNANRERDIDR
jgi:ATP-dependent exoDNAse (exonuclease V) alpha subunit